MSTHGRFVRVGFIGVVLSGMVHLEGQAQEPSYSIPVFQLGDVSAQPGQTSLTVPLTVTFEEGQLTGWTVLIQYDPAAIVVTAIEDARSAEYFNVTWPHEFAQPGNIGANAIYSFASGSPLQPAQSGTVAYVHLCVLEAAGAGDFSLTLGDSAALKDEHSFDEWMTRYGLELENTGHNEMPVVVPGNVHVSGAPLPGGSCRVLEPPPPPPQPQVSFDLRAPESVAPGERFTVELRTTSDAPLLAVTAAMDCDEAVLSLERLEVLPRWNTSTAFVYAEITAGKGEVGLAVIPDMVNSEPLIPTGTNAIAALEFQVLTGTGATSTEIRFVDSIEQWTEQGGRLFRSILRNAATIDQNTIVDTHELNLEIPVTTTAGLLNIRAAPEFLRGDANRSGKVDITDALVILNHLFRGDAEPSCLDAADADDSGVVDVTDAVAILSHLFLGSGELPRPGTAEVGDDPTPDDLDCGS